MFNKQRFTISLCYIYSLSSIALNLMLVVISNMSLLNPGPSTPNLSVFYQNVHGLVTLNTMSKPHPTLNITKVCELQSYLHINKFDIIILNETWLKPSSSTRVPQKEVTLRLKPISARYMQMVVAWLRTTRADQMPLSRSGQGRRRVKAESPLKARPLFHFLFYSYPTSARIGAWPISPRFSAYGMRRFCCWRSNQVHTTVH